MAMEAARATLPMNRSRLVPWLLFGAALGVHLLLASRMRAPVVHADEYSYLYEAHYLALGGPLPHTAGYAEALGYPGYSLLLAPLWWISMDPAEAYRGALVVNALLAG